MSKYINRIFDKIGVKSDRTKNITKHVLLTIIYKGGSVLSNFLLVPLTINYLNTENYGVWLTLSSFIGWFTFFDIGLGNGLRNKYTEATANGNMTMARGYISSAYFTIGAVSLCLMIFFSIISNFIDWSKLFNVTSVLESDLKLLMPIVFGFFCLQLVVKLITTIYTADQHHSMQSKINFYTQIGSLLLIWLMTKTIKSSLLLFGTVFSIFPVIVLLVLNFFAFSKRFQNIKPSYKFWKTEYLKDIFGLGLNFFLLQISGIILFSTDSFLIANLFGPNEVVSYQIAFKYFSITTMLFSIIFTPYWSSFTEAFVKQDIAWINKALKSLIKFSYAFVIFAIVLLIFSNWFFSIWIGEVVKIPTVLTTCMAIYFILTIIITPFTIFINGTGKIFIQTYQGLFSAIINIPISLFMVKQFNLGSEGIILGTIISLIPSIILSPLQTWKIVSGTKNNLLNK